MTTRAPEPDSISAEQIHVIDQTFDALHEEIAATRRPDHGAFVVFVLSLLVPLGAAIWLLRRAERSAIGEGEMLRLAGTTRRRGAGHQAVPAAELAQEPAVLVARTARLTPAAAIPRA